MPINFKKMHGLGNDFVIFDGRENNLQFTTEQIRHISDRKRGVGCDQLGILRHSKYWQEMTFLELYNCSGGVVEACGNMTRCVADILMTEEGTDSVILETLNGSLNCWKVGDRLIKVEMGTPNLNWSGIPLAKEADTLFLEGLKHADALKQTRKEDLPVAVNIGNPHCVFFVDDIGDKWGDKSVNSVGAIFESDPLFPNKTNVEFAEILSPTHIRMRVYERGVGITEACGSGACAVAAAAIRRGLTERKMTITLDGGDLILEWPSNDAPIHMTGPVSYVFDGEIDVNDFG